MGATGWYDANMKWASDVALQYRKLRAFEQVVGQIRLHRLVKDVLLGRIIREPEELGRSLGKRMWTTDRSLVYELEPEAEERTARCTRVWRPPVRLTLSGQMVGKKGSVTFRDWIEEEEVQSVADACLAAWPKKSENKRPSMDEILLAAEPRS